MEWAQTVTWILVITGWWLVNRQNNIREKRKEIRTLLDKIQNTLDEIESQAIKYHTAEKSDDLAFALKRSLNKKFPNKLAILKLRDLEVENCYLFLKQLRQAITLENFDTSDFEIKKISDDLVKNIWLSKEHLSQELEKSFARKYH
jgi:hypothetical protein